MPILQNTPFRTISHINDAILLRICTNIVQIEGETFLMIKAVAVFVEGLSFKSDDFRGHRHVGFMRGQSLDDGGAIFFEKKVAFPAAFS